MEISFKGKTVLVTGSSSGIGRATAIMFAKSDARIIVHYRKNLNGAQETLSLLKPGNHFIVTGDMSDPEDINNINETAWESASRIDVLVNNAAMHTELPVKDASYDKWLEIWNRTIATNLSGTAHLSFLMSKKMIESGGGKIINVSSRGAFRGEPNGVAYGASKAGLNSMSQSMAKALAPYNIFVYTVAPGFTETEMAGYALNGPNGESEVYTPSE